ncbi:predicted protein [Postia placenta Mad-698-R]|nr:predicted protein [Postia placenta Mad-698-R]
MYLFYLNRFALIFLAATNLANQWLFTSTEDCKISTFIQTIAEILQYVVLADAVLSWFVGVNHVLKLTGIQTIVILITGRLCVITNTASGTSYIVLVETYYRVNFGLAIPARRRTIYSKETRPIALWGF